MEPVNNPPPGVSGTSTPANRPVRSTRGTANRTIPYDIATRSRSASILSGTQEPEASASPVTEKKGPSTPRGKKKTPVSKSPGTPKKAASTASGRKKTAASTSSGEQNVASMSSDMRNTAAPITGGRRTSASTFSDALNAAPPASSGRYNTRAARSFSSSSKPLETAAPAKYPSLIDSPSTPLSMASAPQPLLGLDRPIVGDRVFLATPTHQQRILTTPTPQQRILTTPTPQQRTLKPLPPSEIQDLIAARDQIRTRQNEAARQMQVEHRSPSPATASRPNHSQPKYRLLLPRPGGIMTSSSASQAVQVLQHPSLPSNGVLTNSPEPKRSLAMPPLSTPLQRQLQPSIASPKAVVTSLQPVRNPVTPSSIDRGASASKSAPTNVQGPGIAPIRDDSNWYATDFAHSQDPTAVRFFGHIWALERWAGDRAKVPLHNTVLQEKLWFHDERVRQEATMGITHCYFSKYYPRLLDIPDDERSPTTTPWLYPSSETQFQWSPDPAMYGDRWYYDEEDDWWHPVIDEPEAQSAQEEVYEEAFQGASMYPEIDDEPVAYCYPEGYEKPRMPDDPQQQYSPVPESPARPSKRQKASPKGKKQKQTELSPAKPRVQQSLQDIGYGDQAAPIPVKRGRGRPRKDAAPHSMASAPSLSTTDWEKLTDEALCAALQSRGVSLSFTPRADMIRALIAHTSREYATANKGPASGSYGPTY